MKRYKLPVSLFLSIVFLLSVCSCAKETPQTIASEAEISSEEMTEESTAETSGQTVNEEETEETSSATMETTDPNAPADIVIPYDDVMGFQNCYCVGENISPNHFNWILYNEDDQAIANQFGFNANAPRFYPEDLDGDGIEEIICPCQYSADGALRVFIYRNNNGVIEKGDFNCGPYTSSGCTEYDPETGEIIFHDWQNSTDSVIGIDDFEFEEYIYD